MEAKEICDKLQNDFIDDIAYKGLVVNVARKIKKVFIVTFPEPALIEPILVNNRDVLIFSHHLMFRTKDKQQEISPEFIDMMNEKKISLFVIDSFLFKNGEYGTSTGFQQALKMKAVGEFYQGQHGFEGVIAECSYNVLDELKKNVSSRVGHNVGLYQYGEEKIINNNVAILSGDCRKSSVIDELSSKGINTLITGVTAENQQSEDFHNAAKKARINIIGVSEYSSEKWASMNMLDYFRKSGLGCVFLPGKPILNDL